MCPASVAEPGPQVTRSVCRGAGLPILLSLALAGLLSPWLAPAAGAAQVVAVVDGATVRLASGVTARLAGVAAPLPGRDGAPPPHGRAARQALAALVLGRQVRLVDAGRRIDRYGRRVAHLFVGPRWVQGALVAAGHLRVRSEADTRARIAELLAREAGARRAGRGLWADRRHAVRTPQTVWRDIGSWQIVEGRVKAVAARRAFTYLNFGADWRSDFTVGIDPRARRLFRRAGLDPAALKGRRIRVRGWVRRRNGPFIVATHPEQIELLPAGGARPARRP